MGIGMLDTAVSTAIQAFLIKARRAMTIERAFVYGTRARGDAYLMIGLFGIGSDEHAFTVFHII
jgi:hypothetical protein